MSEKLTREESNLLVCYILMTTNYRKGEAEAWEELSQEMEPDGTPTFKHAASNAKYYRDLEDRLRVIREKLDNMAYEA